jgi:ABC-type phosphate transport system substrate-binding protein
MTRKILALSVAVTALSIGVAQAQTTINAGGSSAAFSTYQGEFGLYTGANPSTLFSYEGVGSGNGQKAFFANDIDYFLPGGKGTSNPNGYVAGTPTYGTIVGSTVDIGASDSFLTAGQYGLTSTGGYSYAADGVSASSTSDGPVIQIPTYGTPITIAFNPPVYNAAKTGKPPVYKADFTKLTLTDAQICGIFSGQITNWGTVATLPKGVTSAPITVVYRADSSGNTFLLTNHFYDAGLGNVCNASNDGSGNTTTPGFTSLVGPTNIFASLFPGAGTSAGPYQVPPNFIGVSGAQNLQSVILGTYIPPGGSTPVGGPGTVGYISPNYTSIIKSQKSDGVLTAFVVNTANSKAYSPTEANALLGLEHPGPESTNLTPPTSAANSANPLLWVPSVPTTTQGYPIVGYTTEVLSTCYADKTVTGPAIIALLTDNYTNKSYETLITSDGFTPVAAAFNTAIVDAFLKGKAPYDFNLNIDNSSVCASIPGR